MSGIRRLGRICLHSLPSTLPPDPSLVAFLRSHSHTHEQKGEKATKEQRPGEHSVPVTKEEPIKSASASEPSKEDKLEPGVPGLEEGNYLFVDKSREVFLPLALVYREGRDSLPLDIEC